MPRPDMFLSPSVSFPGLDFDLNQGTTYNNSIGPDLYV